MVQDLRLTLEQSKQWLITTHKGPDGDAVGSVVAWAALAQQLNKPYQILFPDQPADYLLPFLSAYEWSVFDLTLSYEADILFCLDYNAPGRVGEQMSDFVSGFKSTKVMLDHHPGPDTFCDLMVLKPHLCSTTQVIYECLEELGWVSYVNLAMAQGIYLGLMTDTGSFRFPSVDAKTHQIAAHLLSLGLEQFKIHEAVYDVNTVSRLQLRGYAIAEKLQLFEAQGIGMISLSKEELERFNYQKGDTEGLVNVILSIANIQVAIFMMETTEGVKFSFRSKGERFVNAFAQQYFGGGGHQYAAGGFWPSDLQTALDRLMQHLKEL